ncbi:MAG: Transcriptional regulator, partial [Pseudomonadota bacterium]
MNSLRPLRRLMRHGTLPQLAAFVAVVRLGSVTRAAEGLFMAQPTVSGHLAKLSEAAGHPLLENRDRRLRPTAAGLVLYEAAVEVFARLQEAEALLDSPERMADLSLVGSAAADPMALPAGQRIELPAAGQTSPSWPLP